ncbi:lipoprotein [Borreliella burgdorferi]|uniref:Lipoprotein, putative n=2 Tax=Borreliella burgdorferi TaxID=139 RepID=O51780_BORBU|nr:lipoprotein [Borreliella burgdorferi]AGS66836.1 lipoprotein [Borreliella burgdorferi CA382]AAC67186.1 lipoprotein, putative [Borreliella burgdorferi B31]ACK75025.1 putative lipoprotein [Borreliella burgdorferi ZS7]ARS30570.1 lipoprotein [Borreliella burgdorferi]ARS31801.1 lipoprotein [Borreliella burgdorferi]
MKNINRLILLILTTHTLLFSCALIADNKSKNLSTSEIILTQKTLLESSLIKNPSNVEYRIPISSIQEILNNNNDSFLIKKTAAKIKISPQKLEEIKNYLNAYKNYLNNETEWIKFIDQSSVNGNLTIKIDTAFEKKTNFNHTNSDNENLTELIELQMHLEKEILNLIEQTFHDKNLGYIQLSHINSFFPQENINSITKEIIDGKEYIAPHIIANQLLKIKDKKYFEQFMHFLKVENSKIKTIIEKQKISDLHNELYYSKQSPPRRRKRSTADSDNNNKYDIIPKIIDPNTGIEITPKNLRSILSNGDIILIKPKIDWTEFFYFWQHVGIFDEEKYEATKKIAFNGIDSFDIKSIITSNQIKFDTASTQGSGYEKLSTYVQSRILKIFSPITDIRTIQKAINFGRSRYIDNNFGYMVPLISSNLWTDSFNLEEIHNKTYCSLMVDRIYKIAGLNVSRNYEISGIITPGEINAAAYNFYMSYTIAGILPSVLPKRLIKPTLKEKFIGYNKEIVDAIELKKSKEKIFGRACNITNLWCSGS